MGVKKMSINVNCLDLDTFLFKGGGFYPTYSEFGTIFAKFFFSLEKPIINIF